MLLCTDQEYKPQTTSKDPYTQLQLHGQTKPRGI